MNSTDREVLHYLHSTLIKFMALELQPTILKKPKKWPIRLSNTIQKR